MPDGEIRLSEKELEEVRNEVMERYPPVDEIYQGSITLHKKAGITC